MPLYSDNTYQIHHSKVIYMPSFPYLCGPPSYPEPLPFYDYQVPSSSSIRLNCLFFLTKCRVLVLYSNLLGLFVHFYKSRSLQDLLISGNILHSVGSNKSMSYLFHRVRELFVPLATASLCSITCCLFFLFLWTTCQTHANHILHTNNKLPNFFKLFILPP